MPLCGMFVRLFLLTPDRLLVDSSLMPLGQHIVALQLLMLVHPGTLAFCAPALRGSQGLFLRHNRGIDALHKARVNIPFHRIQPLSGPGLELGAILGAKAFDQRQLILTGVFTGQQAT